MKQKAIGMMLLVSLLLTGCASLLERTYSTSEPHSSRLWEHDASGTLRAETYQDLVNDMMILVGQHTEEATLRLYNFSEQTVLDTMEQAALEVQQDTALGSYAVQYITYTGQAQRGYYEVALQVGYRRTAEQIQTLVSATGTEALYSLLEAAVNGQREELAVRIGYWETNDQEKIQETVQQVRDALELTETVPWVVNYYPSTEEVGLIEFLLQPTEEQLTEASGNDGEMADEENVKNTG
ncbi:MAG: hypothetical protein MJ073_03535 [Oscillibacter sp.]|nr:hypothetical protein [Oscillibacter sp.]